MSTPRYLRGSIRQCPKCGSRKVVSDPNLTFKGYGPGIASCANCKTVWEPFDPAQIWDTSDPHCSFKEPCNNCAFRPGSPEQADPAKWKELVNQLKCGASFHCHKGVPIEPDAENGFAYPMRTIVVDNVAGFLRVEKEVPDRKKLRICRGYLNALHALHRSREKDIVSGTLNPLDYGDIGP